MLTVSEQSLIFLNCVLIFMSLLALIDVSSKSSPPVKVGAGYLYALQSFGSEIHTPLHLLAILALAIANSGAVLFCTGLALSIVGAFGIFIKFRARDSECNCFGGWSFGSDITSLALASIHTICSILFMPLILLEEFQPSDETQRIKQIFFVVSVALILATRKILILISERRNMANAASQGHSENSISPTLAVASSDESDVIRLAELSDGEKPLLVVGVSPECEQCHRVKCDLYKLSDVFKDRILVQLVSEQSVSDSPICDHSSSIKTLVVHREFVDLIKPVGYPFAVLISSSCTSRLSPVIYGERAVRGLFVMALNAS